MERKTRGDISETFHDFHDLVLHECNHVTRETSQEVPWTFQDISDEIVYPCRGGVFEEVRNFSHLGLQNVAMLP